MEPIKVLYVDEKGKTVIFLDQDQYVFNTFKVDEGKYKYTTDGEDGWTFSADNGIPFLLRTVNTKNAGNVIWGALITNEKIKKLR